MSWHRHRSPLRERVRVGLDFDRSTSPVRSLSDSPAPAVVAAPVVAGWADVRHRSFEPSVANSTSHLVHHHSLVTIECKTCPLLREQVHDVNAENSRLLDEMNRLRTEHVNAQASLILRGAASPLPQVVAPPTPHTHTIMPTQAVHHQTPPPAPLPAVVTRDAATQSENDDETLYLLREGERAQEQLRRREIEWAEDRDQLETTVGERFSRERTRLQKELDDASLRLGELAERNGLLEKRVRELEAATPGPRATESAVDVRQYVRRQEYERISEELEALRAAPQGDGDLRAEVKAQEEAVANLESTIAALRKAAKVAEESYGRCVEETTNIRQKHERTIEQLKAAFAEEKALLNSRVLQAQGQSDDELAVKNKLECEISRLQLDHHSLSGDNERLRSQYAKLQEMHEAEKAARNAKARELQDLRRAHQELQDTLAEKESDLKVLEVRCAALEDARDTAAAEAKRAAQKAASRTQQLEAELKRAQQDLADRTSSSTALEEQVDRLKQSLDEALAESNRLAAELAAKSKQGDDLQARLKEAHRQTTKLQEEASKHHEDATVLEGELREANAFSDELSAQVDSLRQQLNAARSDAVQKEGDHQRRISQLREQHATLTGEHETLSEEAARLKDALESADAERDRLSKLLKTRASEITSLEQRMARLKEAIRQAGDTEDEAQTLRRTLEELQCRIDAFESEAEDKDRVLKRHAKKAEADEEVISRIRSELATSRQAAEGSRLQVQGLEAQLERALEEAEEARRALAAQQPMYEQKMSSLTTTTRELTEQLRRLQSELAEERAKVPSPQAPPSPDPAAGEEVRRLQQQLEELRRSLAKESARAERLEAELGRRDAELERLRDDVAKGVAAAEQLRQELQERESKLGELERDLAKNEAKIELLEGLQRKSEGSYDDIILRLRRELEAKETEAQERIDLLKCKEDALQKLEEEVTRQKDEMEFMVYTRSELVQAIMDLRRMIIDIGKDVRKSFQQDPTYRKAVQVAGPSGMVRLAASYLADCTERIKRSQDTAKEKVNFIVGRYFTSYEKMHHGTSPQFFEEGHDESALLFDKVALKKKKDGKQDDDEEGSPATHSSASDRLMRKPSFPAGEGGVDSDAAGTGPTSPKARPGGMTRKGSAPTPGTVGKGDAASRAKSPHGPKKKEPAATVQRASTVGNISSVRGTSAPLKTPASASASATGPTSDEPRAGIERTSSGVQAPARQSSSSGMKFIGSPTASKSRMPTSRP